MAYEKNNYLFSDATLKLLVELERGPGRYSTLHTITIFGLLE
jgi:hypothetical protein